MSDYYFHHHQFHHQPSYMSPDTSVQPQNPYAGYHAQQPDHQPPLPDPEYPYQYDLPQPRQPEIMEWQSSAYPPPPDPAPPYSTPPVQPQPDPDPLYNQPPYSGAAMRPLDNHQPDYQQPRNGHQPPRPDYPPPHTDFQHHPIRALDQQPSYPQDGQRHPQHHPYQARQPTSWDPPWLRQTTAYQQPSSYEPDMYSPPPPSCWDPPWMRTQQGYSTYDQPPPRPPSCWDPPAHRTVRQPTCWDMPSQHQSSEFQHLDQPPSHQPERYPLPPPYRPDNYNQWTIPQMTETGREQEIPPCSPYEYNAPPRSPYAYEVGPQPSPLYEQPPIALPYRALQSDYHLDWQSSARPQPPGYVQPSPAQQPFAHPAYAYAGPNGQSSCCPPEPRNQINDKLDCLLEEFTMTESQLDETDHRVRSPAPPDVRYNSMGSFINDNDESVISPHIHYNDTKTRSTSHGVESLTGSFTLSNVEASKEIIVIDSGFGRSEFDKKWNYVGTIGNQSKVGENIAAAETDFVTDNKNNCEDVLSEVAIPNGGDAAIISHRSTMLDADARLIPPRLDTPCLSIHRVDKIPVLALNYHDPKGPSLVIFEGNDEGRRSAIRCAFDPGGETSKLLLSLTPLIASWFPP